VDLEECKQLSHTSNVIEILLDGIFKLPGSTIDVLKTASCIGSTFELKTLSTILSSTERDIRKLLQQGLRQGFIQPSSKNANVTHSTDEKTISLSSASSFDSHYFQFVHDRIHEGFYKFVTETEKPALHLAIGQLLLQAFPDAETPTELFTLVQHLNIGRSLISQADSLVKLANLNLKASSLVLIGRGYSKAIYYAETALELLGRISEDIWQSFYSQSISLYTNLALAKGLNGQIAESKHDFELAYSYAKETLDRVVLLKDRAGIEVGILNYSEAVKLILEALQLCQVKFEISFPSFFVHLAELKGIMKGRTFVEIFKSVPVSDDKISRMIYLLLVYLIPPSFASRNIELCLLIPVISLLHR
jgi:predicted ATPase